MTTLLDTNILIDHLEGREEAMREIAAARPRAISIITWIEVLSGTKSVNEQGTRAYLGAFRVVALNDPIAERAVILRRRERLKLPDALILATAEVESMILVTRDARLASAAKHSRIPY